MAGVGMRNDNVNLIVSGNEKDALMERLKQMKYHRFFRMLLTMSPDQFYF